MNDYVTLKIDELKAQEISNALYKYQVDNTNEYIIFQAKLEGCVVSIYYSSKKGYKAVFSGPNALKEAKKYDKSAEVNEKKEHLNIQWAYLDDQIGSDEVGTGDFFGPVVVVASYVPKELIPWLKELNVNDSKKLKDEQILEIVPKLIEKITFTKFTVHNDKYNEQILKGENMNSIKAILHNQALINVRNKTNFSSQYFIDQFAEPGVYYSYLKNQKEVLRANVTFQTKGESYYPSVAVSSMIARYSFLKEMDVLSEKYGLTFPKGASTSVDEFAHQFVNKYGFEELKKVSKINFANYKKIEEDYASQDLF